MIGTIVAMASGVVASAGTGALAKTVFTKVLTSSESQKIMVKVGMYCVTAMAGAAVGTFVATETTKTIEGAKLIVRTIKSKIESKE